MDNIANYFTGILIVYGWLLSYSTFVSLISSCLIT